MRPLTVILLPADGSRPLRWRMSPLWLAAAVLVWAGGLGLAVVLAGRTVHYEAMRLLNAHLAARLDRYADEVARTERLAGRLAPLEHDLRRRLAGARRQAERGEGVGGPGAEFLPAEIPDRVQHLEQVGEALFQEWESLTSLSASTPAGWPLRGWISSEFGERTSPYTGEVGTLHQGLDIANKLGTPILATADGLVTHAGWTAGGYGKMVEIAHGYGYVTRYGHLSRLRVAPGQRVARGEVIAYVGATGSATGPHCHYEVRLYGVPVNPRPFLRP